MTHYLYAIVDRLPTRWRPPMAGVAGASIVPRRAADLVALSSLVELVPAASPRTLAAHHDVVASVVDAPATLPFGYGTAVPSGLEDWLVGHRGAIEAALGVVRGCLEMTVKLLRLDGAVVQAGVGGESAHRDGPALLALAEALVERAALPQWRYRPSERGCDVAAVAVSFLVPRADLVGFLARIAPVASHAPDVAVVPTGPWAPYSFVPDLGRPPLARLPAGAFEVKGRRAG